MTDLDFSCKCGAMEWRILDGKAGKHIACYCADCQTSARHLGAADYLDASGGTEIFQTTPSNIKITQGPEHLALMQLGPNGLFRWHAGCCGTPFANTVKTPKFSFAGMVLPAGYGSLGPVTAHVQTKAANPPMKEHGFAATGLAILRRVLGARLTGNWRDTPFFDESGAPVVAPVVISKSDRDAARPAPLL